MWKGKVYRQIFILLSFSTLSLAAGQTPKSSDILATVNGEKITSQDLKNKFQELQLDKALGQPDQDLENKVLQDMINDKLVDQKAQKINLRTDKEFQAQLKEHLNGLVLRKMYQELVTNQATVTEEEIKKYYEDNQEKLFKQPEEIKASQILIKVEEDSTIKDEKKRAKKADREANKRLKELQKRIKQGEDFAELAKKFSKDAATREKGGDLGYFPKGKKVKELEEVAWNLEIGEISQPVKTAFGYHIIKLEDKRPEGYQPLDEKLTETIKTRLKRDKEQKRSVEFLDSLQAGTKYMFNEKILSQAETLVVGNPWVLMVNKKDTIKFQEFKKELPGYMGQRKLTVASLEDKEEFLRIWSRNIILKQAARQLGYFRSREIKEEEKNFRLKEARNRVLEKKGFSNYQPSPEEMRKYYDTHPEKYAQENPLHVQHIIFSDSLKAQEVRRKIQAGADFREMALEYYPGEKEIREIAYDLGYISGQEMPPEFFQAAWKLKPGEVSFPVKTLWGYHLIKLVDKKEKTSFEQATPDIRKALIDKKNQQVQKQWEKNLRKGANIWINHKLLKSLAQEQKTQTAADQASPGVGE